MIKDKILCKLILEINTRYKKIVDLFPPENEEILKHLAASSIHLTFFMNDYYEISQGEKGIGENFKEEFLKMCGCDFNKLYPMAHLSDHSSNKSSVKSRE